MGGGVEVTSRYGAWSCAYMVTSEEGKTAVCCFYGGSFLCYTERQVLIQRRIYTNSQSTCLLIKKPVCTLQREGCHEGVLLP